MKKELIIDGVSLINPIAGLIAQYLFNIVSKSNDELLNEKLNKIEKNLGLEKINLTNLELKFINYILEIVSKRNESIDNVEKKHDEL